MSELAKPVLPGTAGSDYERYLRTDELLALQKTADEWVHRDELLFQSVHQTSEIWLKLAWNEIEEAARLVGEDDIPAALRLLRRANDCFKLVTLRARHARAHVAVGVHGGAQGARPRQRLRLARLQGAAPRREAARRAVPRRARARRAVARRGLHAGARARGPLQPRRAADRARRARDGLARAPLQGRAAHDRRRRDRHAGHAGRGDGPADPPLVLPRALGRAQRADADEPRPNERGRARLRELRRRRLGAGVLRAGDRARRGVRDHGPRLGRRDHVVRHRRRLRRRHERALDRRVDARARRAAEADDQGLPLDDRDAGRRRASRPTASGARSARRSSASASTASTTTSRTSRTRPCRSRRRSRASSRCATRG